MGGFKKKKSDTAVKMINLHELAVHRLGYGGRHFVLCWKYLDAIWGFEVEETYFVNFFILVLDDLEDN